jgi:hypothetical protein
MRTAVGRGLLPRCGFCVVWLGGALVVSMTQAASSPVEVFLTGFEPPEYESGFMLAGQDGWVSDAEGGNQVFSGYFPDTGQHALVGFSKPEGTNSSVSVWRPLNYDAVADGNPVVTFTVVLSIADSTDPALRDSFRWSVYNTNAVRLFSLDFDNATENIAYLLHGNEFVPTPYDFARATEQDGLYDLTIIMDFAANKWSAQLNDTDLLSGLPITTTDAGLHLGDIAAVWVLAANNSEFGDNYMVFDDYRVTAAPVSAPRLELVERQADGTAVIGIGGESGQEIALEFSEDLAAWAILVTDTIPASGNFTYNDPGAAGKAERFYRARVIP